MQLGPEQLAALPADLRQEALDLRHRRDQMAIFRTER